MSDTNTFLEAVISALTHAASHDGGAHERPSAILWPDGDQEWNPVVPRLRATLPVLTLGKYDPDSRTGPSIWIRAMLARALPPAGDWPVDTVPVVYLPGVARAQLRAAEECPRDLKPLAWFQYRGQIWNQRNNRDWTLSAFLQSSAGGLGVPV